MELEKIYGSRGVVPTSSEQRTHAAKEDTSDTFARMLQNLKESKARDWAEKVGDTVITRVLADGSVITQIYQGTKLISQIVTRGSHPEAGKDLVSETIQKMKHQALEQTADPLLMSKAAQSSVATAAAVSQMM